MATGLIGQVEVIQDTTGSITADFTGSEVVVGASVAWKQAMFIIDWTLITMGNASDEGDVYVQSYVEGYWYDLCNFHVANGDNGGTIREAHTITVTDANSGIVAITDGSVADDTCTADILLGEKFRVKYDVTVGAGAPAVNFRVVGIFKQ